MILFYFDRMLLERDLTILACLPTHPRTLLDLLVAGLFFKDEALPSVAARAGSPRRRHKGPHAQPRRTVDALHRSAYPLGPRRDASHLLLREPS